MFDNIGKKLMAVAKVFCWIGIIASLLLGIVVIAAGTTSSNNYSYNYNPQSTSTVITGIFIIIFGCLGSWVGALGLYGFGKLIEDNTAMRKLMEQTTEKQLAPSTIAPRKVVITKPKNFWTCPKCGKINPNTSDTCRNCGTAK